MVILFFDQVSGSDSRSKCLGRGVR